MGAEKNFDFEPQITQENGRFESSDSKILDFGWSIVNYGGIWGYFGVLGSCPPKCACLPVKKSCPPNGRAQGLASQINF